MGLADSLAKDGTSRILLVVVDGLGGLPRDERTELEAASVPNLDRLAVKSSLGLMIPVEVGITPGSGPAHLALFGYDPLEYQIGRGVLEALGVGLEVRAEDLCGRANFTTLGPDGRVSDRRAGRIPTELNARLCARLQEQLGAIDDVEVIVKPGREHRFVVVFRGAGMGDGLTDSDPQHNGLAPLEVTATNSGARKSAQVVNTFLRRSGELLAGESPANWVLVRGFARPPTIPTMAQRYRLKPACVAAYPMYRGLARLVGMEVLEAGATWDDEVAAVRRHKADYDFFYVHFKEVDKAGEDGDFDAKVELIERFDEEVLPRLLGLGFDVVCVTGDHSTPAVLGGHSWHPVPLLLWSRYVRPQMTLEAFGERTCARGSLGVIHARQLMTLLLANGLRLRKFGA